NPHVDCQVETPKVLDIAFGMVEKERYGFVLQPQHLLDSHPPLPGDALSDSLDDEHRPDQIEGILAARSLEDVCRESLRPDILFPRTNFIQAASNSCIVALQHLEIPVLVAGMRDKGASDREIVRRYVGSRPRDPT